MTRLLRGCVVKSDADYLHHDVCNDARGRKNHNNVLLSRGYGASIILKQYNVCLKDGKDIFTGRQETEE